MGQYHQFMNFDKKEILGPPALRKLTEWSYQSNEYLLQVEKLLKTRWKGDEVLVVGDYVDEFYEDSNQSELLNKIKLDNQAYNIDNIYFYPYKELPNISINGVPSRYIYNHQNKEYIDLKDQPIQWVFYDKEANCLYGAKFHPLPLLLSCSNGAGGGDYVGKSLEYVGYWCGDSKYLEISDKKLDLNYNKLDILFDEYKLGKNNNEILTNYIVDNIPLEKIQNLKFGPSLFLDEKEMEELIKNSLKKHEIKKQKEVIKNNKSYDIEDR